MIKLLLMFLFISFLPMNSTHQTEQSFSKLDIDYFTIVFMVLFYLFVKLVDKVIQQTN
mgnify:CR=1 FL=1